MSRVPTQEQQNIVHGFLSGAPSIAVEAGAGCAKTTSLSLMSMNKPRQSGLYLAFNKSIVVDSQGKFPPNVTCSTVHSVAYRAVGWDYAHRLDSPRMPAREQARILGINAPVWLDSDRRVDAALTASLAMQTVETYCRSADTDLAPWHVTPPEGVEDDQRSALRQAVFPYAQRAWRDICARNGRLKFNPDHYRKIWALGRPQLPYDFIMVDEYQDTPPVVAGVVDLQTHTQRVVVGDSSQSIMGWAGAIDALNKFPADLRLPLSLSFRFGPDIATEAAKWLELAGSSLDLRGWDQVESAVGPLPEGEDPDVILCRSNAGVVASALGLLDRGVPTAIVGGGRDIKDMAVAAQQLQAGRKPWHPQLVMFSTWRELVDHVESSSGDSSDLKVMVKLITKHGPDTLIKMVDRLVDEPMARVTVSTVHKFKGKEAGRVRIADDFMEPQPTKANPEPTVGREEAMLAYVAVTRAKRHLDRAGLGWVDRWLS